MRANLCALASQEELLAMSSRLVAGLQPRLQRRRRRRRRGGGGGGSSSSSSSSNGGVFAVPHRLYVDRLDDLFVAAEVKGQRIKEFYYGLYVRFARLVLLRQRDSVVFCIS
jgi:hypothetical protein